MQVSFIFHDEIILVNKDSILMYPNTLLSKMLTSGVGIDRDLMGNIILTEYEEYFTYIEDIYNYKLKSLKDLLIHNLKLISKDGKYIPDIFYKNHYYNILEMLDYYGFENFKADRIENVDLNFVKSKIDLELSNINKNLLSFLRTNNIYISGNYLLSKFTNIIFNNVIEMYISESDMASMISVAIWEYPLKFKGKVENSLKDNLGYNQIKAFNIVDYGSITKGIMQEITFMIGNNKFKLNVVKGNVKSIIFNHAFNFNLAYYDTFTLFHSDKDSLQNKESYNKYRHPYIKYDEESSFINNLDEIRSYLYMKFMIFVDNS